MIKPLGNNIILRKEKGEGKTSSGLIIPNEKEKLIVECISDDVKSVKKGQEVVTNGRGQVVELDGEKYLIVNEQDILAIIK